MELPHLNKFEKEKKVIELHIKEGKTLKEISKIVHMSFRDISKIIKAYDKKISLQQKKKEENQKIKKPSLSSQAFKLFSEGKKPSEVKILLDIPFKKAMIFWAQYLKSIRMEDCYEFYQVCQNDLPTLLSIANFIKRNNISGKDISNVLRTANDVINLNQIISNLKAEIEGLKNMKSNYLLNQNNNNYQLPPLGPLPRYYNW